MKKLTILINDDDKAKRLHSLIMDLKVFDFDKEKTCLVDVISPRIEECGFGGVQYEFVSDSGIVGVDISEVI